MGFLKTKTRDSEYFLTPSFETLIFLGADLVFMKWDENEKKSRRLPLLRVGKETDLNVFTVNLRSNAFGLDNLLLLS